MNSTKILHDHEAVLSLVINGNEGRYIIGYDLKDRGMASVVVAIDGLWDDPEVVHLPRVHVRGLWDCNDDTESDIYKTLNNEQCGQVRAALDTWIENNIESDDRFYYTLYDAQTGRDLL